MFFQSWGWHKIVNDGKSNRRVENVCKEVSVMGNHEIYESLGVDTDTRIGDG